MNEGVEKRGVREGLAPHGLDGVGIDDLLVRVPFLVVVTTVVDQLHLFQNGRLGDG
jgi:hypothetical protein